MAKTESSQPSYEQALSRATALCSRSEHSIADIRHKLRQWEVDPSDTGQIIDRLIDEKYIDELRYAKAYVRDKYRLQRWGRVKISTMLHLQHISQTDIAQALNEIDPQEYHDNLVHTLQAKRRTLKDQDPRIIRDKLLRHAATRGYEVEEIINIIEEDDTHFT